MKDRDLAVCLRSIWSDSSIIAKATRAQNVDRYRYTYRHTAAYIYEIE